MKKFLSTMVAFLTICAEYLLGLVTPHHPNVSTNFAKVKYGEMIADLRGKIGGSVHSRNRSGAYMRIKVSPVNPNSSYQSAVRALFTALSQNWRALTAGQRTSWNAAVSNFQKSDVFGDLKTPTGKNLYLGLNRTLELGGVANITTPPVATGTFSFSGVSLSAAAGAATMSLAWTSGNVPAGMQVIVEATTQMSAGKNFFKNLFRYLQNLPAADATPTSIYTAWNARFGTLVAGQKVAVRVTPMNQVTGERGVGTIVSAIVAA
jgi:hypothetical protein